ncbi:membrane protein [Streptomyces sp. AS58]|nr:membrane protein [Streptomyces sp. AS58]
MAERVASRSSRSVRLRNSLSAALIALSCVLLPFAALSVWAAYGLADTGRYVRTMAPLAADPAVRDAVADTVGDEVLREAGLSRRQGAMGPFVQDAVRSFTETEAFRVGWDAANRVTHAAVLRALREDRGGAVTVDLAPVTTRVKRQLTIDNMPLARHIPVRHTEVAVLPARDLDRLRKGYHVLEVAAVWLPVASLVFAVAGIALATCRRRAVTATALGTALGGALLGLAVAIGRRLTLTDLPAGVSRPAAGAVYDALTATLRTASWVLLALGLTVAGAAWLTGRYGPGGRRRRGSSEHDPTRPQGPTRVRA